MSDYHRVAEALKSGASPHVLCAMCPWDRLCISPPEMSSDDIESTIKKLSAPKDDGAPDGAAVMGLLWALLLAGRDTAAQICPVLVVRLRSSDGRRIADLVRSEMVSWDDDSVATGSAS